KVLIKVTLRFQQSHKQNRCWSARERSRTDQSYAARAELLGCVSGLFFEERLERGICFFRRRGDVATLDRDHDRLADDVTGLTHADHARTVEPNAGLAVDDDRVRQVLGEPAQT